MQVMNPTPKLKYENREKHVISLTKVKRDSGKTNSPFDKWNQEMDPVFTKIESW